MFPNFDAGDLHNFERHILTSAAIGISPMCSPTNFAKLISDLNRMPISKDTQNHIMEEVDSLISEFWEQEESVLYAPSTIAIAALLLAYSLCHLDFSIMVDSLPDFFIFGSQGEPTASQTPATTCRRSNVSDSRSTQSCFTDIDSCIMAFERIPRLREGGLALSPASVVDAVR